MLEPGSEKTTSGFGVIECLLEAKDKSLSGTMKIRFGSILKFIFLDAGKPVYASSNDPLDKLGQVLLESTKITQDQFNLANEKKEKGKTLGRTLVELGFLSNRELLEGITQQVRQIVQSLVNLERISYLFEADNLPKNIVNIEIEPERFLLDILGSYQDRQAFTQNLLDLDAVLAWKHPEKSKGIRFPLTPQEETATRLVDEKTNVRDICQALPMDDFQAAKILYGLLMLGYLRRKDLISYGGSTTNKESNKDDSSVNLPPTIDLNAPMEGQELPSENPVPVEDPSEQTVMMSAPIEETTGLDLDLVPMDPVPAASAEPEQLALEESPPQAETPLSLDLDGAPESASEKPAENLPDLEEIPSGPEPAPESPAASAPGLVEDLASEPDPIIDGLDSPAAADEPILDMGKASSSETDLSFLDDLGQATSDTASEAEFAPVSAPVSSPRPKKTSSGGGGAVRILLVLILLLGGGFSGVMWFAPDLLPMVPDIFSKREAVDTADNTPPKDPGPKPDPGDLVEPIIEDHGQDTEPHGEPADPAPDATPEPALDPEPATDPAPEPPPEVAPEPAPEPTVLEKWPPPGNIAGSIPYQDQAGYAQAFLAAQKGDFNAARAQYKAVLDQEPGTTWMLQLEIACATETLIRALSESDGDPRFMVIPMTFKGRACNRVLWGPFPNADAARAGADTLPPKMQVSISKPVPVPVRNF